MQNHLPSPCVMTNTDSFYVKVCGCGVVHLCFGATTLNLSLETTFAVTETLKEVCHDARRRQSSPEQPESLPDSFQDQVDTVNPDSAAVSSNGVVLKGFFPPFEPRKD